MPPTHPPAPTAKVRIICISDTHNTVPQLPAGDILIHAGDLTNQGTHSEFQKALSWLRAADFQAKILVAGNHDLALDRDYKLKYSEGWGVESGDVEGCRRLVCEAEAAGVTYLQHGSVVVGLQQQPRVAVRVFGSPCSPDRGGQNWAFQYPGVEAKGLWEAVPRVVDVLVAHTPPKGFCDESAHWRLGGCGGLAERVREVRPRLVVCGHCHEGRGARVVSWGAEGEGDGVVEWEDPGAGNKKQSLLDLTARRGGFALRPGEQTAVVNASIMAKSYGRGPKTFNKPIVVDIDLPLLAEVSNS